MSDRLHPTHRPVCPTCNRRVGLLHVPVLVQGVVSEHPREPDGLIYQQCATCREFVRCEIAPPDTGKTQAGAIAA